MSELSLKRHDKPVDREGYLRRLEDWSEDVAGVIAAREGIELTNAHWEVINVLREFYRTHRLSPPMRALVQLIKRELGEEKGRSIYLMKLFGGSPAKTACKIAGLPRPSNCL